MSPHLEAVLRSIAFNACYVIWTAIIGIVWLPFFILKPETTQHIGRAWSRPLMWLTRHLLKIEVEFRGWEYFTHQPVIYAVKHQSALDIIALIATLQRPCFVLKKELLWLPIFGQYLWRMGMIAIDRSKGTQALKSMIKQGQRAVNKEQRPIVIFPEGTRRPVGAEPIYHPGIAFLAQNLKVPVIPIALNSGVVWGRNSWTKKPGKVVLEFLPPLEVAGGTKPFLAQLQERIETASNRLIQESTSTRK